MKRLSTILLDYKKNHRKYINSVWPYKQKRIQRRGVKISAYLSIYNDGDFISRVLDHIKDYVDELIVVDGAYEWMVPYLEYSGIDPLRSTNRIYDAIINSKIPYKSINKIWNNELEKRQFGFESCTHRYVIRVDADEFIFFNDENLEGFIGSGCAVAEMQFPLYLAPGWVVGNRSRAAYPAQCFMFDVTKVSSAKHLEYLWLAIPADVLPKTRSKIHPIYEKPIAFCAHLSIWRGTETALHRAVFYIFNWIRKYGIPWGQKNSYETNGELIDLFKIIPVDEFRSAIKRSHVAFGMAAVLPNDVILPTPLSYDSERQFQHYYDQCYRDLVKLNKESCDHPQAFIIGEPIYIDITGDAARESISSSNLIHINISLMEKSVECSLTTISTNHPFQVREELVCKIADRFVSIDISSYAKHSDVLRQFLEVKIKAESGGIYGFYQIYNSSN